MVSFLLGEKSIFNIGGTILEVNLLMNLLGRQSFLVVEYKKLESWVMKSIRRGVSGVSKQLQKFTYKRLFLEIILYIYCKVLFYLQY